MRITSKKNISAYVYKKLWFMMDSHPRTVRRKLRGYRNMRRNRSFFGYIEHKIMLREW